MRIYNLGIKIFSIGIQIPLFPLQTAEKGKMFADIGIFFLPRGKKVSQVVARRSSMLGISTVYSIVRAVHRCGVGGIEHRVKN